MRKVSLNSLPKGTTSHNNAGIKRQMVGGNTIPHLHQFSRVTFKPHEIVEEHFHTNMYEIMFIEEGSGVMKINGVDNKVSKGDCVTVEPHENHEVRVTGEKLVLLVIAVFV